MNKRAEIIPFYQNAFVGLSRLVLPIRVPSLSTKTLSAFQYTLVTAGLLVASICDVTLEYSTVPLPSALRAIKRR